MPRNPEGNLASQFHMKNPPHGVEGEMLLMRAVLDDAIKTYLKYYGKNGRKDKRLFEEVKEWFEAEEYKWPCSFVNICALLGLDPSYFRLGLKKWREREEKGRTGADGAKDFTNLGRLHYHGYSRRRTHIGGGNLAEK